ncbi:unnamed protein product [Diatraea saccharalis]|uniref:Odorant receptor n=1 Tax=Diatraea saccharalis TaxID=40085 RepID=A0A9N9RDP8_9NEOP|nr:unnamed protein product [Diatraea saccharalis]
MELQQVALQSIKNNVFYVEKLWPYVVSTGTLTFPIIGATFTLLSYLTQEEPKKYMVHDLNLPFRPADERFESPYFECMFVYMVWAALICIFNYISYDGFFGMACLHACLKMRLYCKKLELTFRSDDDNKYSHLVKVIEEQQKMFRYVTHFFLLIFNFSIDFILLLNWRGVKTRINMQKSRSRGKWNFISN